MKLPRAIYWVGVSSLSNLKLNRSDCGAGSQFFHAIIYARLYGSIWRVNLNTWLYTSSKLSPMCRLLGNHSAQAGPQHTIASHQRTLFDVRLPARLGISARQKVGPAASHCSSFITLRVSVLRPGRKKAARNAPKWHYSRLCRAGIVVPVVARPIQDMSEVSITDKTVGIRLPRLWCGAIG